MKKKIIAILATCAAISMTVAFAACNNGQTGTGGGENGEYYTVTYMDGSTVLKTEKVKKGEKPTAYTPTKDGGYEFVDWFATPSKNHKYDMNAAVTEDVTVYAGFTLYTEYTREFYILGSGTSELLFTSNWGKVITNDHKLTKASGKNEYSITCDLKEGDQFQFALNADWENKRGFGYLASLNLPDGTAAFSGQGSVYDDSAKGSNIVCEYSGNYTLTLKTYPNEDYYNTSGEGYTEARKEIYNLGTYDSIEWVRNGDVINDSVTVTDFYIKGAQITGWADMYNNSTKMVNNGGTYTMSIYLKEGDQFMFTSQVTKIESSGTTSSTGSEYIKSNNLTEESRTLVSGYSAAGGNMTAVASGMYTFTYDGAAKTLAVTFKAETPAAYDYYIDGNFDGHNYGDFITTPASFKLAETASGSGVYELKNIKLTKDSELLLRAYAAGETADWNHTHTDYQYAYLAANSAFEAASATNNNIKVKTEGVYDISFDSYSKIITIKSVNAGFDIYIKGGMNGWSHNFDAQYKMTKSAKEANVYEITLEFEANWELGLAKYDEGVKTGDGEWVGLDNLGTSGDANEQFSQASGNLKCKQAGTYRVTYNTETGKIDFYAVQS